MKRVKSGALKLIQNTGGKNTALTAAFTHQGNLLRFKGDQCQRFNGTKRDRNAYTHCANLRRAPGRLGEQSACSGSIPENQSSIPLTGKPARQAYHRRDMKVSLSSRLSLTMTGLRSMLCVALHCRTHRLKLFTAGKQADEEQDNTNNEDNFSCPCCCTR
nr:MAG TPA_asm: hypothetical protein [Caudoviricetes sp.]